MNSRREARERVMQALYAHEMAGEDGQPVFDRLVKPHVEGDAGNLEFAVLLFRSTADQAGQIDELIGKHAENWDLSRIALIDRVVLRMAIAEIREFEDIPPKVSINEAIEVVKKYSTTKSGRFVNGVLDAVLVDLRQQGLLKKSGRGLLDSSPGRKQSPS